MLSVNIFLQLTALAPAADGLVLRRRQGAADGLHRPHPREGLQRCVTLQVGGWGGTVDQFIELSPIKNLILGTSISVL